MQKKRSKNDRKKIKKMKNKTEGLHPNKAVVGSFLVNIEDGEIAEVVDEKRPEKGDLIPYGFYCLYYDGKLGGHIFVSSNELFKRGWRLIIE